MTKPRRSALFTVTFLMVLATAATLADEATTPLARLSYGASGIDWEPQGDFVRLTLVVTGPEDFVFRRDFPAGEQPFFTLFDDGGQIVPDGGYNWELTGVPVEERRAKSERRGRSGKSRPGMTQSGFFRILGGSLLVPSLEALSPAAGSDTATKDQVIADDLIVIGRACVGLACVNGEMFGLENLKLKEDVLRLKFEDTSTGAGNPTNDWQITVNDVGVGGADRFSIKDIDGDLTPFTIEAGAPDNSIYLDDTGRVGLGTSTPTADLHIVSGNTPTLRFAQGAASAAPALIWDVAGTDVNFFVRDFTNSQEPLRIQAGAPTSSIEIAATTGFVGIGTATPDEELDIESIAPGLRLTNIGPAGGGWRFATNGNTGRFVIRDFSTNNDPFKIDPGSNGNLVRIGVQTDNTLSANTVSIGAINTADAVLQVQGSIEVDGLVVHPDYVFEPSYELESIKDHAAFMWQEKHLPALPKAPDGLKGPVDLVSHQMGILEELEKAHIYIEQLHNTIEQLHNTIKQMQVRLEKVEESRVE